MIQTSFPEDKQAILWRSKPSTNTWNLLNTFLHHYFSTSLIAAAAAKKHFSYSWKQRWPMQILQSKKTAMILLCDVVQHINVCGTLLLSTVCAGWHSVYRGANGKALIIFNRLWFQLLRVLHYTTAELQCSSNYDESFFFSFAINLNSDKITMALILSAT